MNTTKTIATLVASGGALLLASAALNANLISLPATYELAFGFLVVGALASLAISEYRKGTPRRVTGIGLRRLRFRA